MKVTMLGCGYVGLVSGTCFAEFGASVTCFDIDKTKVNKLKEGVIPIYEPGLNALVEKNLEQGRLSFTNNLKDCIPDSDLVFVAVGTPTRRGDGHADLSYVYQAVQDIAPLLKGYTVIVDKSTVPVGTARNVKRLIAETNPDADFDVASNPEFLKEGSAIADCMKPDRVVIGSDNAKATDILKEIYSGFIRKHDRILIMDILSAEMTKYAANAMLATRISFMNNFSD